MALRGFGFSLSSFGGKSSLLKLKTEPTTTLDILNTSTLWERRDYLWDKYAALIDKNSKESWEEFLGCSFDEESYREFCADEHLLGWNAGEDFEGGELYALNELHNEIGHWAKNTTMVRESHFVEYAQNWIEGVYSISPVN